MASGARRWCERVEHHCATFSGGATAPVPVRILVGGRSGEDSMTGHEARPSVGEVTLRDVTKGDLSVLFEHQLDPEANRRPSSRPGAGTRTWCTGSGSWTRRP